MENKNKLKKVDIKFNSDSIASEDLLGRKSFAEQIAYSLVNNFGNDFNSIVFGLNGKWGSGKSTILKNQKTFEILATKRFVYFLFTSLFAAT